ncbi:MAG TPA: hypothetical protein VGD33_06790 [Chitinophagaceae bacterium]
MLILFAHSIGIHCLLIFETTFCLVGNYHQLHDLIRIAEVELATLSKPIDSQDATSVQVSQKRQEASAAPVVILLMILTFA